MKIILATNNQNKAQEIKDIVAGLGIEILSLKDLKDFDEVEETGKTFADNAFIKANYFHNKYKCPVLADDSGLVVPSLGNSPGVYSSRYAGEHGNDLLNNQKLLKELKDISNRQAYFNCTVCYIDEQVHFFDGQLHGRIAYDFKGDYGFGYDPLFELENGKRLAEIPLNEKNKISHRAKAFKKWLNFIKERRMKYE